LVRIRRFAQRELKKQTPRLDDHWIPHLHALGLASDIQRWRDESRRGLLRISHDHESSPLHYTGAPFTGQLPEPFVGRPDWTDAFYGELEEEEEEFEDIEGEDERWAERDGS
jgi:hypothetical protein